MADGHDADADETPYRRPEFGPDFNPDDFPLPDIDPARLHRLPTAKELRARVENARGGPTYTLKEVLDHAWSVREAERRRAARRRAARGDADGAGA